MVNVAPYYPNKGGSLYLLCDRLGLDGWEQDILKRLIRCRAKGNFDEDIKKTANLIDIYLREKSFTLRGVGRAGFELWIEFAENWQLDPDIEAVCRMILTSRVAGEREWRTILSDMVVKAIGALRSSFDPVY